MQEKILGKLLDISLKARILRSWQTAASAAESDFSEREMITLELINAFPKIPITEKKLSKIFVVSPSSVSDMVRHLTERGVVKKMACEGDPTRGKALSLTNEGVAQIDIARKSGAARFSYLFSHIEEKEWSLIAGLLKKVDEAATEAIKENIFGI